ncbi:MAG: hypothetical protein ACKVQB_06185 [Bacteroidia bacterium]
MKKLLLLSAICLFSASTYAIPMWLREAFGCVYHWNNNAVSTPIAGGYGCMTTQTQSGSSWLWGPCPDRSFTFYDVGCNGVGIATPVDGSCLECIAETMTNLRLQGYTDVNPDWEDPELLQQAEILKAAVVYRLYLAGYVYDEAWENLSDEDCPAPTATINVLEAQHHTFVCP